MKLKTTFLLIILLLTSCQSGKKANAPTSTGGTAMNAVVPQPTLELTMTVASTSIPSATLTANATSNREMPPTAPGVTTLTPTSTPSPTVTTTLTPMPTFDEEQLETRVAELLASPMNCKDPCWWGAIPGKTTMNEVKQALLPYNFYTDEYEVDGQSYLLVGVGHKEESSDFEFRIVYSFSNSILTGVTAYAPSVSDILAKYGQPDEVWLSAMNDPREQFPLIWFVIVYFQEGIGIGYVIDGSSQGDIITGCVADESAERLRNLRLVIPNSASSYKDFTTIFDKERLYLPLEEATTLTIEEFVQLFNDSTRSRCVTISPELWN